jgi:hypothetical protein
MIEKFDMQYADFFKEISHLLRWKKLYSLYTKDYGSFRVLFTVETYGLISKWKKPEPQDLHKLLQHMISGGQLKIPVDNVAKLMEPIWPLEMVKLQMAMFKTFSLKYRPKDHIFTYMTLWSTALVP